MLKNEDNSLEHLSYVKLCTQSDKRHGTEHTEHPPHPSQRSFTTPAIRTTAGGTAGCHALQQYTAVLVCSRVQINNHPTRRFLLTNCHHFPFLSCRTVSGFSLQVYRQEVIRAMNGACIERNGYRRHQDSNINFGSV